MNFALLQRVYEKVLEKKKVIEHYYNSTDDWSNYYPGQLEILDRVIEIITEIDEKEWERITFRT